ncbi:MAG: hypothetical protein MUO27_02475, partial [Sedimentisphaerales bacterium]|nr:hypothetical protein [Sedimentisphaerales bacterium]
VWTDIKAVLVKAANLFGRKRRSFMPGMSRLGALFAQAIAFYFSRRLDNIAGWRLGRITAVLREFSYLVCKFDYLFRKLCVLLLEFSNLFFQRSDLLISLSQLKFKFSNAAFIKLFRRGCQFLFLSYLAQILSVEASPLLEETITLQFEQQIWNVSPNELKIDVLMLGASPNSSKYP